MRLVLIIVAIVTGAGAAFVARQTLDASALAPTSASMARSVAFAERSFAWLHDTVEVALSEGALAGVRIAALGPGMPESGPARDHATGPDGVDQRSAAPGALELGACVPSVPEGEDAIARGDTVAVRIFERSEVAHGPRAAEATAHDFERLDLSGDYVVDSRGQLALPILGRIAAFDRGLACLEAEIADRYRTHYGKAASVTLAFRARQPVLVRGAVRTPGAYALMPDMTVRHVLALAGGEAVAGGDARIQVELLARREELLHLALGLELETARLHAERGLRDSLDLPAARLAALAEALGAARVTTEQEALRAAVREQTLALDSAATRIAELAERTDMLAQRQQVYEAQLVRRRNQLAEIEHLNANGLSPLARVQAQELDVMALERTRLVGAVELADARAALQSARRHREHLAVAYEAAIADALRACAAERAALDAQLMALAVQLGDGGGLPDADLVVRIARRTSGGRREIAADLATPLRPGDVVEVVAQPLAPTASLGLTLADREVD